MQSATLPTQQSGRVSRSSSKFNSVHTPGPGDQPYLERLNSTNQPLDLGNVATRQQASMIQKYSMPNAPPPATP